MTNNKNLLTFILFISILSLFLSHTVLAASISAVTNKIIYAVGDTLTITGTINTTGTQTITSRIYNSTFSIMNISLANSSGNSPNTFSIVNTINNSYSSGNYYLTITDGTNSVNMSFRVVSQLISLETYFINSLDDVINVNTSTIIQTGQENFLNGNFTELLNLSKSSPQTIHYGNSSVEGKTYHFVLVDETNTSSYDRLYIDDDIDFRLLNDTEDNTTYSDIEYQQLRDGSLFSNGTFSYIVGEIERTTGNKIILFKPTIGKPPYDITDTVKFLVIAKNATHLLSNQVIAVDVRSATGNVTPLTTHTTNAFGWFNASKSLTAVPAGTYVLNLNESLEVSPFPVEAFKLFVTTTDTSNKPTSSFAPNSQVRIVIISKSGASSINLTSFTVTIYYPNASTATKSKSDFTQVADGVYRYDLSLSGAPTGRYSISVTGSYGTNTQTASTGFEIQSVNFEAMAMNARYMEEAESSGAMINAFPPLSSQYNSNITIMTFLSNISVGGMMAKGPEGFTGLINLTSYNCSSIVTLTELKDENGVSYSVNYQVMNMSMAISYFEGLPGELPPQQILSQCMVIFPTPNRTGIYRTEFKINYQGEERYAGVMFSVQKLWAYGSTVDFKGDDSYFFAPNSTVRIKLAARDLVTDQLVNASNITSGKIIELYRVYPSFKDILGNSTLRNTLNENITNGTISFTSPTDEGFFMMKFRFTADVAGTSETGIGDASFMLKKYMVWGELAGAQQGQWFVKPGQNITLTVTVMDIDKAQSVFSGYSTQKTCTGCSGFVVNVSELRNDQQFKTVTGYTVQTGTIINSTNPVANVTIVPTAGGDMQPGWYSVDLIVNDTNTGDTYFGWGWFEIRNFWVDVQKVDYNGTHYIMTPREGPVRASYAAGQSINFTVLPKVPGTEQILPISAVSVENVLWLVGSPPVSVSYTIQEVIPNANIVVCPSSGSCQPPTTGYVVRLAGLPTDKQGDFRANVRVTTTQGSDTGSFEFDVSTYRLETTYRIKSWPPLFATTENFTVNFTATDFQNNPHNITNATIDDFFDSKRGRPIKMKYGENYTTDCNINSAHDLCIVNVNISNLLSGEYHVRFSIVDNQSVQKSADTQFKLQNVVVSIPTIEEAWVWETETVSKKLEQNVRKGQWSNCGQYGENVNRNWIPNATFLCNNYEYYVPDQEVWPSVNFNLTAPNVSYTKEVFGYIPLMEEQSVGRFGGVTNKSKMWMYANGSHMWINATPDPVIGQNWVDLRNTTPIAVGSNFRDSKGGLWKLDAIGDQTITITGLSTVYRTGVLINTSYSKSGVIKLGQIQESDLGGYIQVGGQGRRAGLDLNNNSFTNDTVYFAIADNATAGVYDTFFFSTNGNFTGNAAPNLPNPISVSAPRASREFGFGGNITLLSIDPRAQSLKFYSRQVGDWNHLGEVKWNSNITIPVMVASPDGTPQSANVSITGYKNMRTWLLNQTTLVLNQNITGVGEIRFNSSNLTGTGEYSFSIRTDETMEEWKWPMATVRGFLVDGDLGEALYVSNFQPLELRDYRWDTPGVIITRIHSDRRNISHIVNGTLLDASAIDHAGEGCQVYNATGNITDDVFAQFLEKKYGFMKDHSPDNNGYFFYNSTSGNLYKNTTCLFNLSAIATYQQGSYITVNRDGRNYNVSVLSIDISPYSNQTNIVQLDMLSNNTPYDFPPNFNLYVYNVSSVENDTVVLPSDQYSWNSTHIWLTLNATYESYTGTYNVTYEYSASYWRAAFGVVGVNPSTILPMANDTNNPEWGVQWGYMQNVSIFETYYDVILANDTYNYQRCIVEPSGDGQCAKKAWLVNTSIGNFSHSSVFSLIPGQNYTSSLYLVSVGPNDGDGITIGNFTAVDTTFGLNVSIAGINMEFPNNTRFNVLNESILNYDLDRDGGKNRTYYMLLIDSDFNTRQNLSDIIIDDDLEIVTWSSGQTQLDLRRNEDYNGANFDGINRTNERWQGLPSGLMSGNACFGQDYNVTDRPWEFQPCWDMPFYNTSHMLLKKGQWRTNSNQNVSVLLKVYNFDQTAISDVNISVTQMARHSPWIGFQTLTQGVNYTVDTTYNKTDSYGYGLLKIVPNPTTQTWPDGNYQVIVNIQTQQGNETWERWFCVGGCG